jgi:hypothetical protein
MEYLIAMPVFPPDMMLDIAVSSIAVLLWYYVITCCFLPTYAKKNADDTYELWREKRLAWIMTLLSAIVSNTVVGIYLYYLISGDQAPDFIDISNFDMSSPERLMKFLHGSDRLSNFCIRFFCTYLLIDTIYMTLYYRTISNFQSWLHHIGTRTHNITTHTPNKQIFFA